jgi:hypothetical protein
MKPLKAMNSMKNLERLNIHWEIKNTDLYHYADQIKEIIEPLFQGLAFSTNLQEIILEASLISMFGDLIVRYLPQMRKLKIGMFGFLVEFAELFNWLPDLKCLDTLVLSNIHSLGGLMSLMSEDEEMAPFYKNPMTRLKRLELEGHWNSEFKEFFDSFPCLETLTISQRNGSFKLPIQDLISVLNSFGDVKNLSLSDLKIKLTGLESYDATKDSYIFQEAVKIIDGKFPIESTQIKISTRDETNSTFFEKVYDEIVIKEKGSRPFLKVN